MRTLLGIGQKRMFPCPICGEALQVRESKKGKPYVVCNSCGVQLFVRTAEGIRKFEQLVEAADSRNIWERIAELETRYRKACPECGKKFWVVPGLIKTSWFDGHLEGFKCPELDCDGMVKLEDEG